MFPSATRDPGESPIHSSNPLTVISTVRSNGADSKSNPGAGPDISSSGSNSCKKGRHTGTVSLPANPLGLSFEVVQRLDYLKRIQRDHRRLGDRYEQLPNVTALIQAYRSGQLEWSKERKVTFWSKGRQVLRLTQFDWDRFENVARENDGWKGFWVEGLSGPGPWKMATSHRPGGAALGRHLSFGSVQLEVCIPGLNAKGAEMHFVDDRDVVVPTLYEDDVQLLRSMAGPSRPQPFSMGSELCAYLPDQLTLEEDLEQMNALGYSLDRELIQYLQESPNRASAKDHLTLETIGLHTRHVSSKPHKAPSRFLHRRYAVLGNDRRVGAAPRLGGAWRRDLISIIRGPKSSAKQKIHSISSQKHSFISFQHSRAFARHTRLARRRGRLSRQHPRLSKLQSAARRGHLLLSAKYARLSARHDILSLRHGWLSRRPRHRDLGQRVHIS